MAKKITTLDELIFYAVDKASPYALALHTENDTLEKILDMTLTQLSITTPGKAIMWQWINAHSAEFHAKPVIGSEATTVNEVRNAVYVTLPKAKP